MAAFLALTPSISPKGFSTIPTNDKMTLDGAVRYTGKDEKDGAANLISPPITPPNNESPSYNNSNQAVSKSGTTIDHLKETEPRHDISHWTVQGQAKSIEGVNGSPTPGHEDSNANIPPSMDQSPSTALSPATRLKHKIQNTNEFIVCPGVYDGLSARIGMAVGFETLYMVFPTS